MILKQAVAVQEMHKIRSRIGSNIDSLRIGADTSEVIKLLHIVSLILLFLSSLKPDAFTIELVHGRDVKNVIIRPITILMSAQ